MLETINIYAKAMIKTLLVVILVSILMFCSDHITLSRKMAVWGARGVMDKESDFESKRLSPLEFDPHAREVKTQ